MPQQAISSTPAQGQMLTYDEAADLLRIDKRTLRRRIADGRYVIYGEGTGKRILYSSILTDIQQQSQRRRR